MFVTRHWQNEGWETRGDHGLGSRKSIGVTVKLKSEKNG